MRLCWERDARLARQRDEQISIAIWVLGYLLLWDPILFSA
jgi:hypothetical protein